MMEKKNLSFGHLIKGLFCCRSFYLALLLLKVHFDVHFCSPDRFGTNYLFG